MTRWLQLWALCQSKLSKSPGKSVGYATVEANTPTTAGPLAGSGGNPCTPPNPALWLAEVKPSRIHQWLTLVLASASLLTIASLSVAVTIKVTACVAITLLARKQLFTLRLNTILSLQEPTDTRADSNTRTTQNDALIWRVQREGDEPMSGTLIQAGYRSAGLVIMVLQSDDTRRYRIPVWVDAVTATQFSYLHYQVAFNAQPAQPPTLQAILLPFSFQSLV